jgi:hypothetical protein
MAAEITVSQLRATYTRLAAHFAKDENLCLLGTLLAKSEEVSPSFSGKIVSYH